MTDLGEVAELPLGSSESDESGSPPSGSGEGASPLLRVHWDTAEAEVDPGEYRVVLEVAGARQERRARVLEAPAFPVH